LHLNIALDLGIKNNHDPRAKGMSFGGVISTMAKFSGAHLKSLRKEAGLTQKELASRIGLSRETIVAIENEYVGSIDKLSIEVVNAWWSVCRRTVSAKTKESFKSQILRFFNIHNS